MRLKSIAINGFKSFADRISIEYRNGITGVIGPNGSGKSNIIDAVRWVMGEQTSKSLRADDPTDIIFAGSQNRKPLSLAEVSLVFTNDGRGCPPEFLHLPEVSIGRRIYRNGEREYLMNKEPCRLRDIVEFLLSQGLGSKGYSIIQQEKRDRIIQATPDDLRDILEETAGITVFKQRRKESEKRLESTADKLRSLQDIEDELKNQSEHLHVQLEAFQKKQQLNHALREAEIALTKGHIVFYNRLSNELKHELSQKQTSHQEAFLEAGRWEAEASDLKAEHNEITLHIKELEDQYDEKKLALTKYEERRIHEERRLEERTSQRQRLTEETSQDRTLVASEEERLQASLQAMEACDQELSRLDSESELWESQLEEVEEALLVHRSQGEELRSEQRAVHDAMGTLRTRNEGLLGSISKTSAGLTKIEGELEQLQLFLTAQKADMAATEATLATMAAGTSTISHQKSVVQDALNALKNQVQLALEARDTAKTHLVEIMSHKASLEKLVSSSAGLSDGSKMLRQQLAKHLNGFVFENIQCPPEYAQALEKALPDVLQAALVADHATLIDLLNEGEELGISRVGVLVEEALTPLSAQEYDAAQKVRSIPGLVCLGDVAQSPKAPLQNLLHRVWIARDEWLLFKGRRSAGLGGSQFIWLTGRGTAVGGVREFTFGVAGESLGLLQRKQELEQVTQSLAKAQDQLAHAQGHLVAQQNKEQDLASQQATLEAQLSRETVDVLKVTSSLESARVTLRHTQEKWDKLQHEKQNSLQERNEYQNQFGFNQAQLENHEQELREINARIDAFDDTLTEVRDRREELKTQLVQKKSQKQVVTERQTMLRRTYEDMSQALDRMQNKLLRNLAQLEELATQIEDGQSSLASLEAQVGALRQAVGHTEAQLATALDQEAEIAEKSKVIENKLRKYRESQASQQKNINDKQMELARCEVILDTALKDAQERFQLASDVLLPQLQNLAPAERELLENPQHRAQLENEVKNIHVQLAELGGVNERAQEEFTQVEERRVFLKYQKEDVQRSVDELKESITHIEEATKKRFFEIYTQVNEEFKGLFPILFPGGYGELHLVDPNDLLNTGVEILVRLPGKRLQSMSLFSGGEKALTAISLIFSLLKTTPAPFCFLDEVDAPLDEANVGRFNTVLEALSDQFQFVVITHNRRTMEVLDTIYGISMTEPGVSKLVSVDLSEVPGRLRKAPPAQSTVVPPPSLPRPGASLGEAP